MEHTTVTVDRKVRISDRRVASPWPLVKGGSGIKGTGAEFAWQTRFSFTRSLPAPLPSGRRSTRHH
jgi:hypothetical protein